MVIKIEIYELLKAFSMQKIRYNPKGKEKIINDKMTIIEFEKEINDE